MDYVKEYKSFINSYYLSEGLRITTGILLPALILNHFNDLASGIIVSTGAMCVSASDTAGPIHHRRNGMMACTAIIFGVSLLTGLAVNSPVLLGALICFFCFLFSIISVYGNRASSIGISALLVMVLQIDRRYESYQVLINSLYVLGGGVWYTVLSLLLYSFRPYKLAQQALGECIQATADYFRIRASFYSKDVDYDKTYHELMQQQVSLHEKQNLVRELLFKSRDIVKESTNTSRILVMIFLDIVDLFERVMTAHRDYEVLHHLFENSDILHRYQQVLYRMANELDEIGIAVKSGRPSPENPSINTAMKELRTYFYEFRDQHRTAINVEGFISLRNILEDMEDIADRLHTLSNYTTYDRKLGKSIKNPQLDYEQFITHQDMDPKLLKDNLTLKSNAFRHSLRVSITTLAGYIISKFFPFGHSYWTLLTIIVILKPAYGLTKKRNFQRLLGTIGGAAIGLIILYLVRKRDALFVCMTVFMVGAYSFMRTRYLIFVMLMTPYILLLFYLLSPPDFKTILFDRIIDTAIGSAIAFLANLLIVPVWENEQIKTYMIATIENNASYFTDVAGNFSGNKTSIGQYKLSRKEAFVSLANLSDAFNRMLSEPKSKQRNIRDLHQFVVTTHMFTSHVATLSYHAQRMPADFSSTDYLPLINNTRLRLNNASAILEGKPIESESSINKEALRKLNDRLNALTEQRKTELKQGITDSETRKKLGEFKPVADQFNFINKAAADIEKICQHLQAT